MTGRPILFSGPMVRALQDGTKTMTRRVVTQANSLVNGSTCSRGFWSSLVLDDARVDEGPSPAGNPGPYLKVPRSVDDTVHRVYPRWQPGDRLWVRERFCRWAPEDTISGLERVFYWADYNPPMPARAGFAWKPSIHMPRWASRITLEVKDVRVERVQEIASSPEDMLAEGITAVTDAAEHLAYEFRELWNSINSKRGFSYESNCWVWVVKFIMLEERADD